MDGDYFNDLPPVFQVRTLMPVQYFTQNERRKARSPEKRLMYAILEDAVSVYCNFREPATRRQRRVYKETVDWFASDEASWVFSFRRVCDALDLDPSWIREGIRRRRENVLAASRARRAWVNFVPPGVDGTGEHAA